MKDISIDQNKVTAEPTHQGILFGEDFLPALDGGWRTISEIARLHGVTRQTLHRLMAGRTAVTPEIAVRLGKLCGNGPNLWLNTQARYDAWAATKRLGKELDKIPTLG